MSTRIVLLALCLQACGATSEPCVKENQNEETYIAITAGGSHTCGLATDGRAYCWGWDKFGQLGTGEGAPSSCSGNDCAKTPDLLGVGFESLKAGMYHTCGLAIDGRAFCWGADDYGQLGNGGGAESSQVPVLVVGGIRFKSIAAGWGHTCGLTTDGRAFCWGIGGIGQLGDGLRQDSQVPVLVDVSGIGPEVSFTGIAAGMYHTCGLAIDGRAFCWGADWVGQIGNGEGAPITCGSDPCSLAPVPVDVSMISPAVYFTELTAGEDHTCGLTTDGRAFCWGRGDWGQLGNGTDAPSNCTYGSVSHPCSESPILVDVSGISPPVTFALLATGENMTCGLATDGRAFCWGANYSGQLGNGDTSTCKDALGNTGLCSRSPILVDVSGLSPPVSFTAITAGGGHTCGITLDGRAFCWGNDMYGQLGNGGGSANSQVPVLVAQPEEAEGNTIDGN